MGDTECVVCAMEGFEVPATGFSAHPDWMDHPVCAACRDHLNHLFDEDQGAKP